MFFECGVGAFGAVGGGYLDADIVGDDVGGIGGGCGDFACGYVNVSWECGGW